MEIITREIIKMREDAPVKYLFKTYDQIFDNTLEAKGFHPNFIAMARHLQSVFVGGIQRRANSPSSADRLLLDVKQVKPTDEQYLLVDLAQEAQYRNMNYLQHQLVQNVIFEKHPHCFAIEAPLHDEEWSGIVDVLLMHPFEGWVDPQDFKPKAHQERDGKAQVFRYKRMIQKILLSYADSLNVDISLVRGGYFDDRNAYLIM